MSDAGAKLANVTVKAGGKVSVTVKPTGQALKTLNKKGKVTVKVTITFTPSGGGSPVTKTQKVVLKKAVHH